LGRFVDEGRIDWLQRTKDVCLKSLTNTVEGEQAMNHSRVSLSSRSSFALIIMATALIAALFAGPVSASTEPASARSTTQATCIQHSETGALGREGGLLALRSVDGSAEPVKAILASSAVTLHTTRNGGSSTHVSYVRTDCLGREGGLLDGQNR
jgi:hypothetical protein